MPVDSEELSKLLESILDKKLEPIMKSIEFVSKQYDEMLKRTQKLEESHKEISAENKTLKIEIDKLKNDLYVQKKLLMAKSNTREGNV